MIFYFIIVRKAVYVRIQLSEINRLYIYLLIYYRSNKIRYLADKYGFSLIWQFIHHISANRTHTALCALFHLATGYALVFFHYSSTPSAIFAASSGVE